MKIDIEADHQRDNPPPLDNGFLHWIIASFATGHCRANFQLLSTSCLSAALLCSCSSTSNSQRVVAAGLLGASAGCIIGIIVEDSSACIIGGLAGVLGGITALKTLDDLLAHTEKAAEVVEGDSVDLKSHVEAISSVVSAIELAPRAFSPDTLTSVASDIEATSSTIRQYLTSLNYVVREISTAAYTFREDYDQYGTEPYNEFLAITARIHNRNDDIARSAVLIRSMLGVLTIKSDVMENVIETNI